MWYRIYDKGQDHRQPKNLDPGPQPSSHHDTSYGAHELCHHRGAVTRLKSKTDDPDTKNPILPLSSRTQKCTIFFLSSQSIRRSGLNYSIRPILIVFMVKKLIYISCTILFLYLIDLFLPCGQKNFSGHK